MSGTIEDAALAILLIPPIITINTNVPRITPVNNLGMPITERALETSKA